MFEVSNHCIDGKQLTFCCAFLSHFIVESGTSVGGDVFADCHRFSLPLLSKRPRVILMELACIWVVFKCVWLRQCPLCAWKCLFGWVLRLVMRTFPYTYPAMSEVPSSHYQWQALIVRRAHLSCLCRWLQPRLESYSCSQRLFLVA